MQQRDNRHKKRSLLRRRGRARKHGPTLLLHLYNVDLAVFLINKGAKTSILNGEWDTPIAVLARHHTETTPTIYKTVYEPLLRMQHRVSGSEFDELFPDQDPIQIEDDVLP